MTGKRKLALAVAVLLVAVLGASAIVRAATAPDFSITVQPQSQTINSGSSASYAISISPSNGFSGSVSLSAANLPNGTSASWTVGATKTSGASTSVSVPAGSRGVSATLTVGGGQPSAGTYSLSVSAKSGSLAHTATPAPTLVIQRQNAANFMLAVNPSAQTAVAGSSVTSTVSISRSDWSGAVTLGPVSGISGATAMFTPNPVSSTGSTSTLTLAVPASTTPGLYTEVVNGSGVLSGNSTATRSAAFTVLVKGATTTTATAPSTDATNAAIPATSISAALSGATSDASGTITFKVFGPQASAPTTCTAGGTQLGAAVTVSGNKVYNPTASFTPTSAGTYWWYAAYSGDTYNNASASPCGAAMASTIVKNTTSTSASAPGAATATALIAPSAITSTLTGATASATGTITYKVFGPQATAPTTCTTGGTQVGAAITVSGNKTYNPTTGFTPSVGGTYWWYASYSGDGLNSPSSSPCGSGMTSTAVRDFSVSSSPSSQSALTGGRTDDSASYSVAVTPLGGFSGTVSLSVSSGLPSGATPSFNPVSTSSTSTLTIDVGTNVAPGTYTPTIQGTATVNGTTVTRTTQVTLVVTVSRPFSISGDIPSPLYPGAAAQSFTVTLSNPNSFSIKVTGADVIVQPQNAPGCSANWFKVTLPSVPSGGISVAANGSVTLNATAQMLESGTDQDACAGKQLKLSYTGSYSK
jgi:hypothetical protein